MVGIGEENAERYPRTDRDTIYQRFGPNDEQIASRTVRIQPIACIESGNRTDGSTNSGKPNAFTKARDVPGSEELSADERHRVEAGPDDGESIRRVVDSHCG